jgi:hypothetical protein
MVSLPTASKKSGSRRGFGAAESIEKLLLGDVLLGGCLALLHWVFFIQRQEGGEGSASHLEAPTRGSGTRNAGTSRGNGPVGSSPAPKGLAHQTRQEAVCSLQIQNYGGRRVPGGKPVAPKFDSHVSSPYRYEVDLVGGSRRILWIAHHQLQPPRW